MSIDLTNLNGVSRLLIEANLKPIQGSTFQPTGFPDLGAATYEGYDENGNQTKVLLVESQQSMANRLERVCWDDASDSLVPALDGLPYVRAQLWGKDKYTSSIQEAHRIASPYITGKNANVKNVVGDGGEKSFGKIFEKEADLSDPIDVRLLAKALFKYDPSSVLHGVFMAQMQGTARLRRSVSAFVEARDAEAAVSGGVKNDRVSPSPKDVVAAIKDAGRERQGKLDSTEGFGNVPYSRTNMYSAKAITAYFNLDLSQIRAYGLGENAERLLTVLALWKIRKVLETGLRFRTDCDLIQVGELKVSGVGANVSEIPETAALEAELPVLLRACEKQFAAPPVTEVAFA